MIFAEQRKCLGGVSAYEWRTPCTPFPARRRTMLWQSRHPGVINALHLLWLFLVILAPVLIARLLFE